MQKLKIEDFNRLFKPEYRLVIKKLSIGGNVAQDYLVLEQTIGNIVSDVIRILCSDTTDTSVVPDIILRKMFNR